MNQTAAPLSIRQEALPFLLWARIWSQLVSNEERAEAWQTLDLPSSFSDEESTYWTAFHVGLPAAPIALLLHAALNIDGANAREDWMRVSTYLGLQMTDHRLPPDHLAGASEIFAMIVDRGEPVLAAELCDRYFLPWCTYAEDKLKETHPALQVLPQRFRDDLLVALSILN